MFKTTRRKPRSSRKWPRPSEIAFATQIHLANTSLQCEECGEPLETAKIERVDYEGCGAWVSTQPCGHMTWIDFADADSSRLKALGQA